MKSLIALFFLFFSFLVSANQLNNIVIFGDSLSDNGNLYAHMHQQLPKSPPYYEGRFSNGPVWVEQLANSYLDNLTQSLSPNLLNYAFGGAAISARVEDDTILFTLNRLVNMYLKDFDNKADPNSLFIIWIGGNNYLTLPENEEQTNRMVVKGIMSGALKLIKAGAKHILILDIPDLGRSPAARAYHAEEKLTRLTNRHNALLKEILDQVKPLYPEVQWLYFNTSDTVNKLFTASEEYGFTNVVDTCSDLVIGAPSKRATLLMTSDSQKIARTDGSCDGYLFFDPVHPTFKAHQIIANEIRKRLDEANISITN